MKSDELLSEYQAIEIQVHEAFQHYRELSDQEDAMGDKVLDAWLSEKRPVRFEAGYSYYGDSASQGQFDNVVDLKAYMAEASKDYDLYKLDVYLILPNGSEIELDCNIEDTLEAEK